MPTTLAVGDVIRIRVACYTANQASVNVGHFRVSAITGSSQTDLQVAQALNAVFAPRYKLAISVNARYRGISVQRIKPLPPTFPQIIVSSDGPGLAAGDLMATQVSGIVSSTTNNAGPAYRGRIYIPFPSEAENDAAGLPIADYVDRIDDIGEEFYTSTIVANGGNDVTLIPVIWHRAMVAATDIVGRVPRQKWATQRRRGSYGKVNPTPF